jgi:uncharacterized protein
MGQIWLALITGLTTGGISCLAVQGGLLASALTYQESDRQKYSVLSFMVFKLIAYTVLGAFLGYLGSRILITSALQGYLQIFAGIIMLFAVGQLLNIHPIFRKLTISPPKFAFKLLRRESKQSTYFTPALLGFLTVLIPCGITQSMMILAISSGSVFWGAAIMFAFILGTSPVFFALGLASTKILSNPKLKLAGAAAILILSFMSINTGQVLRGSPHTLQNYYSALKDKEAQASSGKSAVVGAEGSQEAEIRVITGGYRSEVKTLQSGVPVTLKLVTENTLGCSRAFTIPEYNISLILPETGVKTVEFTPTKTGKLTYTCSMGMYTGSFDVI